MRATTCVNNVTVVDVASGTLHAGQAVLLSGEKIYAVEPLNGSNLDGLEAPETVDGSGLFLCPGLIDSHVHTTQGDFTPRQNTLGWIESSMNCGVTSMVSAGEVHTPGRPFRPEEAGWPWPEWA